MDGKGDSHENIRTISQQVQTISICSREKLSHVHLGEKSKVDSKKYTVQDKSNTEKLGGEGGIHSIFHWSTKIEKLYNSLHSIWNPSHNILVWVGCSPTLFPPLLWPVSNLTLFLSHPVCRLAGRAYWRLGCALTFASEAKFENEAKISFRLEAKKKPDFTWFTSMRNTKNLKRKQR